MFEFVNDPTVRLMLLMSKENIDENDLLEARKLLAGINEKRLFELCHEHELDGVVGAGLVANNLLNLDDEWKEEYEKQFTRQSFLKQTAIDIGNKMFDSGIPIAVLKNGGIMLDMVDNAAKCPMEDIDTLVKKSDFMAAHRILCENGFHFKFRSEYEFEKLDQAYADGSTEYYIETPDGDIIWLELAWRAIAGRWIRQDLEPNADDILNASHLANGTNVSILSPEDNLLQVCIHTAKHSYLRAPGIRLHLDVERIVAHNPINWELFLRKVESTHVKTATYFSLYIPSIIFCTPIPPYVLERLKPSKKKIQTIQKSIKKAGLLHPKEKKFTKLEFLQFQVALYDDIRDIIRVINPGFKRLKEIYHFKCPLLLPIFIFIRGLDLVGIRKKKQ